MSIDPKFVELAADVLEYFYKISEDLHYIISEDLYYTWYYTKRKMRSSCEGEESVDTHLCKLCVILRSCVLLDVCPH